MNQPRLYHFHRRLSALAQYHQLMLEMLAPIPCRYGLDEWLFLSGTFLPGGEAMSVRPSEVVILDPEEG